MKLVRLQVQQLPGIRPGFGLEDIDPGINLVVGPNASGKSSIVRALEYLVASPGRNDPLALSLEAEFEGRAGRWLVQRTGSQVAWRRGGSPAEPPPLPDPRFFHCYWLRVEDLLASDNSQDRDLVARLRRELTGGYDVDALLNRSGLFQVSPRHGRTEAKALRQARAAVGQVARTYTSLRQEQERLPDLERKIGDEARIRTRIDRLERALELLDARRKRIEVEAALDGFPAAPAEMALLQGNEQKRLNKLEERKEKLETDRNKWRRKRATALAALEDTGLGSEAPDAAHLELQRRTVQNVRELLRDRTAALEKRDHALAAERTAAERLGARRGSRPTLDPETVSEAESLAIGIEGERKSIQELEARLEGAPDPLDPGELDVHREAASALRAWLGGPATQIGKLLPSVAVTLLGTLVAFGGILVGRRGVAILAAAVAVLAAAGAALVAWVARRERSSARARFEKHGLEPPSEWTVPEVSSTLDEIEARLAELRDNDARARRAEGDRERLERARRRLGDLETRKCELAEEVGFDPERTATSFHEFVRLVDRVDEARSEAEEAELRIKRTDTEIRQRVGSVHSFLVRWKAHREGEAAPPDHGEEPRTPGDPRIDDPRIALDAVETALARLSQRCEAAKEARETIERADEELGRVGGELERLDSEAKEIFEGVGLEPRERTTLDLRLGSLHAFREREEESREARIAESQLRLRLEAEGDLLALVEADDEEGLRSKLRKLQRDDEHMEGLKAERTAIETRLEDAGADRKLEEAVAAVAATRATLEDARAAAFLAAAGEFLLQDVKEEHRTEHEPEILQDARERFERFTHHGWTLELDDEAGFTARDLTWDEVRSLKELSSGTRMQLLLAVRVAWTRTVEESREPLPLVLDEALTTSDPERFARVAESLASLADEEDRQIFYLCAQPTDVLLWERALGERPRMIDLAEVRFGRPSEVGPDDFALPGREPIPEPAGESPEEYAARLGVPSVDPWEDPGAIRLFHLLRDDLGRLYRLMTEWGLVTQGPLEAMLKSSAAEHAEPDANARRRLGVRCRVSRLWVRAWREGRGRPIDRGVLERSGAVSDTFIGKVSELAEEESGDPRALVRALSGLPRFRSAKVKELEAWLEEHGYLPPGEPLELQEREARVLQEAAGLAEPGEVREVVRWLEAGLGESPDPPREEAGR